MKEKPVVFITGSSRGIGLGIAKFLATEGFNIVLNGRTDSENIREAEMSIRNIGAEVEVQIFDVANIDLHKDVISRIYQRYGRLDCLVNNAGVSVKSRGDLLDISPESFDEQVAINMRGTFFLTQAICREMLKHESSSFRSVITISSSNAVAASVTRGEYCMIKSALSMMTKLYAVRLAEQGINVYEVRPGLIHTDMTAGVKDEYDRRLEEGFSPINRWGKPFDVGQAVAMLARGDLQFTTGEAIHVDGGLLVDRY